MDNSSENQKQTQQEEQIAEVVSEELTALVEEIEVHLQRYLRRSVEEYPPGSQADWVATSVVERVMTSGSEADFKSMAKLCVFLVESLGDISTTYEEFYSEQLDTLKEQSVQQATQIASLEEENSRLRERLHTQAEELKIRELSLRSIRLQQRSSSSRHSAKASLSSSHNSGAISGRPEQQLLVSNLQEAVTEKSAAIHCLEQQLHAEKMKNREFDEKVSLDDDEEDQEAADEPEGDNDEEEDDDDDDFNVSGSAADFLDSSAGFDRELVRENAELQSRMTELMRENSQYRQLGAQLTLENQQLRTATRELRSAVERLHSRLYADDLLNSAASQIFEELSLLRGEVPSDAERAAADARAADESFEVDGEPEEIPDDAEPASAATCRDCRQCSRLKESVAKLERRHEDEATRIREIVTQNVCMKAELEDWKADMAEKVRQNVALNGQLESCQRLLSRLSPGNATKAKSVFGRVLIDKGK